MADVQGMGTDCDQNAKHRSCESVMPDEAGIQAGARGRIEQRWIPR